MLADWIFAGGFDATQSCASHYWCAKEVYCTTKMMSKLILEPNDPMSETTEQAMFDNAFKKVKNQDFFLT